MSEYHELEAGLHIEPPSFLVWVMRERSNSFIKNCYPFNVVLILPAVLTAHLKLLDYFLTGNPKIYRMVAAMFVRGKTLRLTERNQISC